MLKSPPRSATRMWLFVNVFTMKLVVRSSSAWWWGCRKASSIQMVQRSEEKTLGFLFTNTSANRCSNLMRVCLYTWFARMWVCVFVPSSSSKTGYDCCFHCSWCRCVLRFPQFHLLIYHLTIIDAIRSFHHPVKPTDIFISAIRMNCYIMRWGNVCEVCICATLVMAQFRFRLQCVTYGVQLNATILLYVWHVCNSL